MKVRRLTRHTRDVLATNNLPTKLHKAQLKVTQVVPPGQASPLKVTPVDQPDPANPLKVTQAVQLDLPKDTRVDPLRVIQVDLNQLPASHPHQLDQANLLRVTPVDQLDPASLLKVIQARQRDPTKFLASSTPRTVDINIKPNLIRVYV